MKNTLKNNYNYNVTCLYVRKQHHVQVRENKGK